MDRARHGQDPQIRSSFFFFSSRRRHTRLQGDWSSDVCSSDLANLQALAEIDRLRRELSNAGSDTAVERLRGEIRAAHDAAGVDWRSVAQHNSEERERGVEGKRGDLGGGRVI